MNLGNHHGSGSTPTPAQRPPQTSFGGQHYPIVMMPDPSYMNGEYTQGFVRRRHMMPGPNGYFGGTPDRMYEVESVDPAGMYHLDFRPAPVPMSSGRGGPRVSATGVAGNFNRAIGDPGGGSGGVSNFGDVPPGNRGYRGGQAAPHPPGAGAYEPGRPPPENFYPSGSYVQASGRRRTGAMDRFLIPAEGYPSQNVGGGGNGGGGGGGRGRAHRRQHRDSGGRGGMDRDHRDDRYESRRMPHQFRTKSVCQLDCKHCGRIVCMRGMKAMLLADTRVELYSTDSPPVSVQLVGEDYTTRNCHCKIRDVACLGCGEVCGYHITSPCGRCMDACNNGHFWMFHTEGVKSIERLDESGGKALLWAALPVAERDVDPADVYDVMCR